MGGKDQPKLLDKPDLKKMTGFPPSFMSCKLHLDKFDLAHEKLNNASKDEDQNVTDDKAKQVESSNSKVVNLLPLEVGTLYVTCRGSVGCQGCQGCQAEQLTVGSCHKHFGFTKVGLIRTIEDGQDRNGYDDPKALVDHQDMSCFRNSCLDPGNRLKSIGVTIEGPSEGPFTNLGPSRGLRSQKFCININIYKQCPFWAIF